ncbi:MFS transporter [Streptomyces sp. 110]|uniref:MFS transporter n=1 Tax=Streptomyces endocoffeicus TaxID=2898945 RepID=A0ABS1PWT7_9ACTN|nr:MFS transporter [Streptomyces endocoffeicus]MBL1116893.1 MFS transporter [Streptomyces endocoffeicus]
MASYLDAAAIVSTGSALVLYKDRLGLGTGEIGTLSSMLTLSIAAGALLGGRLGDRYGRRRVFMATVTLLALGAVLLAAATSSGFLYVGIVVVGFAAGADLPVSISLIGEEAPEGARGTLVALSQVLWYGGIVTTQLTGLLVGGMGSTGARVLYGHVAVVATLVLVLRFKLPESRQWIDQRRKADTGSGGPVEQSATRRLLKKPHLKALTGLALFYALTNLAANTKGQFGTYLYVEVAGGTVRIASAIGLATLFVSIPLAMLFMKIVDGRNRMRWYALGAICFVLSTAAPAALGVHVGTLALSSLTGAVGSALAFEGIFKVWSQEVFPTLLRATAQGMVIAFARVVAAAVALWTPTLLSAGPRVMFAALAAIVAVATGIGTVLDRLPKIQTGAPDRSATSAAGPATSAADPVATTRVDGS